MKFLCDKRDYIVRSKQIYFPEYLDSENLALDSIKTISSNPLNLGLAGVSKLPAQKEDFSLA